MTRTANAVFGTDWDRLYKAVQGRAKVDEEIKALQASRDALNTLIETVMSRHKAAEAICGDFKAVRVKGTRTSLSREKLLDVGVTPEMLEEASEVTEFSYIRVGKVRDAS